MKIVKINGKEHKTTDAIADYIKELEYYYEFRIGGRVIEVHYGLVGKLIEIFKDFNSIPSKILGGCHKAFLKELKIPISDKLKNTYWFLVQSEDEENAYILPYVYWKIMPPEGSEDIEDDDVAAEPISDI